MARRLGVSSFSFWKIALLLSKGRLQLGTDVTVWLDRAARAPGIATVPATRDVLVHSTRLQGDPHGDPADGILLAQAQVLGASLLTCDRLSGRVAGATSPADDWNGYGGVGQYRHSNGNTYDVMNAAHGIRRTRRRPSSWCRSRGATSTRCTTSSGWIAR
ncbi:MAG: type II toxin-antitoxin system VapC family toxin [Gemmatimonadetes bacterium]|nr:type II toxin-antitoxin system VapC family toxin [Gemmatimonadota bacterium]